MSCKFTIFVIIASVAQSSFGQSLSSSQFETDYSRIEALFKISVSSLLEGGRAIFTEIKESLAKLASGDQNGIDGADFLNILNLTNARITLTGQSISLNRIFDGIATINPEAFIAITTVRTVAETQLTALIVAIYASIHFVRGTILPSQVMEIPALQGLQEVTIENIQAVGELGAIAFAATILSPLQSSRGTVAKIRAAIQNVQDKVSCRLVSTVRNTFAAIKILRAAVANGTRAAAEAALPEVDRLQRKALLPLRSICQIEFNFFKACLVADSLLLSVNYIDSTAISPSENEAISKYENLVNGTYTEVKNYLDRVQNGITNGTAPYFCTLQSTEGTASSGIQILPNTLLLTDPPTFNVTNLQINETTTQLAIWGDRGIAVVELPKRWGKEAAFQGGKEIISCRSHSLDERLFHCFGVTEVRRARWHPGSTKDSHLLVLTSENTFHLYECELNGSQSLVRTWSVGPASGSPSKIPTSASLGDTAVDFDFVTPTLKPEIDIKDIEVNKIDWKDIEWPILVLKGNGDVCAVHNNVLSAKAEKPVVTGPLSIYPRADDNYGVDSCSIMCLQTTPPLVVIATSNGKVYHSILLREGFEDDEKKTWSQYGSTFSLHTPEDALFVYECVEMELGLCIREDEKKYSCPVHLHVDRGNSSRYFCSHNAGIHVVNLPMVSQLQEYIQGKDEDADLLLPTLSNQSSSQYLVCTRTKSTQEPAPILGFGLLQEPCILIALLHTGMAISLSVVDLHYLLKIKPLDPVTSPSKKIAKEPFDVHIKNILKHDVSQPILKLGPNAESSPQEILELLLRATHVFRTEHFARQDKVQAEIAKRIRTLRALKTHQLKELESLAEVKKKLQEAAEHLAERYEDIKDKQEELARRAEEVLRLVNQRQPSMSAIEKEEANELKKMNNKMKELSQQLEKLKNKSKYQSEQLMNWDKNEAKKDVIIRKSQEDTIKAHLTQMSVEIADLVSTVKSLQEELSA